MFYCFICLPTLFSLLTIIHGIWKWLKGNTFKYCFVAQQNNASLSVLLLSLTKRQYTYSYAHSYICRVFLNPHSFFFYMKLFNFKHNMKGFSFPVFRLFSSKRKEIVMAWNNVMVTKGKRKVLSFIINRIVSSIYTHTRMCVCVSTHYIYRCFSMSLFNYTLYEVSKVGRCQVNVRYVTSQQA